MLEERNGYGHQDSKSIDSKKLFPNLINSPYSFLGLHIPRLLTTNILRLRSGS